VENGEEGEEDSSNEGDNDCCILEIAVAVKTKATQSSKPPEEGAV
jgi:hypothetical protein